jgi:hypothetical protein
MYQKKTNGIPVLIINKLTKSLIDSNTIEILTRGYFTNVDRANDYIIKGTQLGNVLGRRLKLRSESRSLFTTRLNTGKIDRRLVNEIGHGNNRIFSTLKTENRKKAFIHISIDASSSMGNQLFGEAQTTAVAIAKAASMTNNMDVVISYRSIKSTSGYHSASPLVLIAYDSRKDKFSKITSLFKYIQASGTTPEGLCYEAIKKQITSTVSADTDSYLLNISDGMPGFSTDGFWYNGASAENHTRRQIESIQSPLSKPRCRYRSRRSRTLARWPSGHRSRGLRQRRDYANCASTVTATLLNAQAAIRPERSAVGTLQRPSIFYLWCMSQRRSRYSFANALVI